MRYVFGDYSLDPTHYELRQAGRLVPVEPRVFEVLAYLVQHAGQTVTTEELLAQLYPQQFAPVERLTNAVTHARKVLGENSQAPRYIQTVRRRGYRFLAPVHVWPGEETDQGAPPPPATGIAGASRPPAPADAVGAAAFLQEAPPAVPPTRPPVPTSSAQDPPREWEAVSPERPDAERRQLTLLFCALVDSTVLAGQLDPEDYRTVLQVYLETCATVMARYGGNLDTFLSDGALVCFGYPQAHDDDPQRAVRAGLGIVEALARVNARLAQTWQVQLAVRIGIHTGVVVAGDLAVGASRAPQALVGDAPIIAARLQERAAPNTVVCSAATARLVEGYFLLDALGPQGLKGLARPVRVYRVVGESGAQTPFDVAVARGLTPLVGRELEVGLLRDRWSQVQAGRGHIVVLSGEAGIGKSRLVQVVKEEMSRVTALRIEYRCSPYYQHSAFYPVIAHLERVLAWRQDDPPTERLRKVEEALQPLPLPLAEVVPPVAALLALPLPAEHYPPLALTPQRQRQKTLEALLTWLLALTEQQPVLLVVEDLHWIDPSTLEFLTLLVDQGPTARLLTLLTCRPEFQVPWGLRTHLTPIALQRLPQAQVEEMLARMTGGQVLPPEVVAQIVARTDGVPLFVEELTKTVLESGLLQATEGHYRLTQPLPSLAIPATLHAALLARLDRLAPVKAVAQLGAVLGRTFAYAWLQAVTPLDEAALQQALAQLVDAELLYQRGVPPQATYLFKHALIQDVAYQSLLKSTRQQYHQRIAQVLEAQFPETAEAQPELLAHHCTEAGLTAPAVGYWQRAGQRAVERSANVEAITHLTKGLAILTSLPDTLERRQQELDMQLALGPALVVIRGPAAPEVEQAYARAQELCQQVGETPQHFPVLWGLWRFYNNRADYPRARALGERLLRLAQQAHDAALLLEAHHALWGTLLWSGEFAAIQAHLAQGRALYDPQQHHAHARLYGHDPGVCGLSCAALSLWILGYPDQAQRRSEEALTLAHAVAHPYSLAIALRWASELHQSRREPQAAHELAEACVVLADEQGFAQELARATIIRGWALATRGHGAEGMAQMHQGLAAYRATGTEQRRPYYLAMLAEASRSLGQPAEGSSPLAEALATVERHGERWWAAELHRLQGELRLAQAGARPQVPEAKAETWLQRALDVARRQEAKSLELRAAISLSRLWQQQGKQAEARALLAPVYGWFTEGFDTADLQEAKALLDALGEQ